MKAKTIIPAVILIILAVIGSSVFFLEKREMNASACAICGRQIHPAWAFTITFNTGKKQDFCCAKCGITTMLEQMPKVRSATATDFATGRKLSAKNAFYVWGSDAEHCAVPQKSDWTNAQPMQLTWDRCIPSLVAFETRHDAEQFQSEHGGRVVTYPESLTLIQSQPAQ
jgi:nitrous oxide reductase accessory protein NosL